MLNNKRGGKKKKKNLQWRLHAENRRSCLRGFNCSCVSFDLGRRLHCLMWSKGGEKNLEVPQKHFRNKVTHTVLSSACPRATPLRRNTGNPEVFPSQLSRSPESIHTELNPEIHGLMDGRTKAGES